MLATIVVSANERDGMKRYETRTTNVYNVVTVVGWGRHTIGSYKPIKLIVKIPFDPLRIIVYLMGNCTIANTVLDTVTIETS